VMPADSSLYEHLTKLWETKAETPIEHLAEQLQSISYPRGRAYFGPLGDQIDAVVAHFPSLRWWITRKGLVVDKPLPRLDLLRPFDRVAGKLVVAHWDKGLSKEALDLIAAELDRLEFNLKENMQPKAKQLIADVNRRRPAKRIDAFLAAVQSALLGRCIRRRLYLARERYLKVVIAARPIN
jgi:hypothetical protein